MTTEQTEVKRPRVAFLVLYWGTGGTERVTQLLLNNYDPQLVDRYLIVGDSYVETFPIDQDVKILTVSRTAAPDKLGPLCLKHKIDIVVVQEYWHAPLPSIVYALNNKGLKTVMIFHSTFYFFNYEGHLHNFPSFLRAAKAVKTFICLSQFDVFMWRRLGVKTAMLLVNPQDFSVKPVSRDKVVKNQIAVVGRITGVQKQQLLAVRAFAKVITQVPDATLLLVGLVSQREQQAHAVLVAEINKLGLARAVKFMNFTQNVNQIYEQSQLVFMPSLHEGLPMVMLEAKYNRVPVVAARMDYLECKQGVRFAEQQNATDLVAKLAELLLNEQLQSEQVVEQTKDLEQFEAKTVAAKWYELISALMRGTEAEVIAHSKVMDKKEAERIAKYQKKVIGKSFHEQTEL